MEGKKLIIIDSHSLLYRAFHALPPLVNSKGQPTGAIYGFLLTLFKAIKDVGANYIVACFDTPKATFRHQAFGEYKAHRAAMPEGIVSQIPLVKVVLQSFGVPIFEKDGYEADDVVATISQTAKQDAEVYIVSGDLDNLQLVDQRVNVYTLGRGIKDSVVYNTEKVVERFGVNPEQMNDFKALTGDVSDNIPGVPGVGKTTAAELIQKYQSIENLYNELATDTAVVKPKIKEALKQNKEKAFLSLKLVKTDKNVPIDFVLESCKFGYFNKEKVKSIFLELGFNSLVERIDSLSK